MLQVVAAAAVVAVSVRTMWPEAVPATTRSGIPGAIAIAETSAGKGMLARFQVAALLSVRHIDAPPVHNLSRLFGSSANGVMNRNWSLRPEVADLNAIGPG